ncbi:hypothetical protein B7C42_01599 [Nocardia cerradoensis]|uniref:Uncharacterized protein n=1 Tax=Nocardia cerradoensis TaxID=85688 RepID=A0A231HCX4_9NOCA|nr:hypothetical protein [Nocardia cerradoensis]OXR46625.1 hypothetical protein B7C42_01599 [Nocardia cerradoensis]
MTVSVLALVIASAALITAAVAVGQSRTDAKNCAQDARNAVAAARNAATAARKAAESVAQVDNLGAKPLMHIENWHSSAEPGSLAPTIPIDARRVAREMHRYAPENFRPATSPAVEQETATPGASADNPRAGQSCKP